MSCTVEDRQRVERAVAALRETQPTATVDVTPPRRSQHDVWTLDAVLPDSGRIPPAVLRELAIESLSLCPLPSQAGAQHVVAVPASP